MVTLSLAMAFDLRFGASVLPISEVQAWQDYTVPVLAGYALGVGLLLRADAGAVVHVLAGLLAWLAVRLRFSPRRSALAGAAAAVASGRRGVPQQARPAGDRRRTDRCPRRRGCDRRHPGVPADAGCRF